MSPLTPEHPVFLADWSACEGHQCTLSKRRKTTGKGLRTNGRLQHQSRIIITVLCIIAPTSVGLLGAECIVSEHSRFGQLDNNHSLVAVNTTVAVVLSWEATAT